MAAVPVFLILAVYSEFVGLLPEVTVEQFGPGVPCSCMLGLESHCCHLWPGEPLLGGAAELAGSGETGGLAGLEYPGAVAVAALRMQMRPGVPLVPAWRAGWCSCGLESQCCR